jgi:hypothetical protein
MATDNVLPFERRAAPVPPADFDAPGALARCRAMLAALDGYGLADDVAEACVTMLLVNLHDLLQRARALGQALVFTELVEPLGEVGNITELVAACRNAACHVWGRRRSEGARGSKAFHFHRIAGYCPRAFEVDGKMLGCDYYDDVALYYGHHRLYLKRHAARALADLEGLFG